MSRKPKRFYKDLGERKCVQCGILFVRKQGEQAYHFRKRILCSHQCQQAYNLRNLVYKCEMCGEDYKPMAWNQRFCGSKKYKSGCSWKHLIEQKKKNNHDYRMRGKIFLWMNTTKIVR